jgi:hypothetical protein
MAGEKCLSCGRILFRRIRVDEMGHTVIRADFDIELEGEGFERFFRCPGCQAPHVVTSKKNSYGISQLVVSHVKA